MKYPTTRRDENIIDDYHGTKVSDPYRWLEDPDSPETKKWVDEQNAIFKEVLSKCNDRDKIFARLKEMQNYPKYSCPFKQGNKYFTWKNEGLQNQSVLYIQDSLDGEPREFLDPNKFSADGTASIGVYKFSESGNKLAYSVHKSGSDWKTIYIKDVETGTVYNEQLDWVKFSSIAWTHDEKGIYYCKYDKPKSFDKNSSESKSKGTETDKASNQKIYYHQLGTSQDQDKLIYTVQEEPEWMYGVEVTDDGRYLIITVSSSCENVNRFYYVDLQNVEYEPNGMVKPVKLIDKFEAMYSYVTNNGTQFILQTNKNSPKYKIIQLDISNPDKEWIELVPQSDNVMQWVSCVGDSLAICYLEDVKEILKLFDLNGKHLKDLPVPTLGSVSSATGKRHQREMFYYFISFLHPGVIFHYDFDTGKTITFRQITVNGFDPSLFETKQVFYESKDGTKVPMFIVHKKGLELNGENPTLLYGYGGFYISLTPSFSVSRVIWMLHFNGIIAIPNLRGGNEYGEEWHSGGILDRKQNVFDDFISAAETLIKLKYTSPKRIAINGGSNGGLLVCACINQRPDLFGAAVAMVPVTDMLRFHKFTIGYAWCSDYGCADKPEDFKYLIKYSPLHTVKKGSSYPALLITTADHDDRVVPLHSLKYLAEVQHQLGNEEYQQAPLVARIETKAGHGHGKPMEKILEEYADVYTFVAHFTGAKWQEN